MKKAKIILSVIFGVMLIVIGILLITRPWSKAKTIGKITIVIKNEKEKEKEYKFKEDDTLKSIVTESYDATFSGTWLESIDDYKPDDEAHEYWAFYINGDYATVGVCDAELVDGNIYKFVLETW